MMTGRIAAGGEPPAASTWVEWRERRDRPLYQVRLWPNRSLTPALRAWILALVAGGVAVPVLAFAATPAFPMLAPFAVLPPLLLWLCLRRSDADGRLVETLTLWRDEVRVERQDPRGRRLRWSAEPRTVRLRIHDRPVESYLTLKGQGREIELGAFLSPEERVALAGEIETALTRALRA